MSKKLFLYPGIFVLVLLGILGFIRKDYSNSNLTSASGGFAVVELFTSEGCSSCPPADKMLAELKNGLSGQQVYFLAFHVDYWNNLGWKDPFSNAAYSKRQNQYASALNAEVYTPQMIVNGKSVFVGSNRAEADAAISAGLKSPAQTQIQFNTHYDKNYERVEIHYVINNILKNDVLNIAVVQKQTASNVLRGENGGKKLIHVNVVRAFKSIPVSSSGSTEISFPQELKDQSMTIICYTQDKNTQEISGAISRDLDIVQE